MDKAEIAEAERLAERARLLREFVAAAREHEASAHHPTAAIN